MNQGYTYWKDRAKLAEKRLKKSTFDDQAGIIQNQRKVIKLSQMDVTARNKLLISLREKQNYLFNMIVDLFTTIVDGECPFCGESLYDHEADCPFGDLEEVLVIHGMLPSLEELTEIKEKDGC